MTGIPVVTRMTRVTAKQDNSVDWDDQDEAYPLPDTGVTEQSVSITPVQKVKKLLIPGMTETTNATLPSSAVTFDVVPLILQMS